MRWLLLLTLVGCTEHYEVVYTSMQMCKEPYTVVSYECRHQSRFSLANDTLKICDTKEECSKYCDVERKK